MERKKSSSDKLNGLLKAYNDASGNEKRLRTCYFSNRTMKGIHFLQQVYTEIYFNRTGMKKVVPKDRIVGMAIESMINDTLAKRREEAEKSKTTST